MNCKVCGNTSTKNTSVSFFRFPKETTKCMDWAERCNLNGLYEKHGTLRFYKSFRICSDHFDSKDIVFDGRKKRLLQSASPVIGISKNEKEEKQKDVKNSRVDGIFEMNLCRLCATENKNLTDIYGWKGRVLNLENKLKYFPMMINKYDILPLRMCHQCIAKVNQFYDFIINCMKAETKLRVMLDLQAQDRFKTFKTLDKSPEAQETSVWHCKVGKNLNKTPNAHVETEVDNFPNLNTHHTQNNYKNVVKDNLLSKDNTGCFCQDQEPVCTKTNQLINHTNFIKEVDFSANISFEHDYSNIVSRDQLLSEPEINSENDQSFVEETKHPCDVCLTSFCGIEVLNTHSLTHSVQSNLSRGFICEACNKPFFSRFEFEEHSSEHMDKNYACKICDKKFHEVAFHEKHVHQSDSSRSSKIYVKSDEKASESIETRHGKNSSLQQELHQIDPKLGKTYSKSLKRKYQFRNKLFKNRQVCLAHERKSHEEDVPYLCQQCGKTFRSKPSLRQHNLVHSDKRLYSCQECGMSFKRKDTLSNHLRIHTGERPFVCKICGFAFKQRGDCIKHEKNHQKTCKVEVSEDDLRAQEKICDLNILTSSPKDLTMDISEMNDGTLWDDEKNLSLLSYITITEETGSLEDIITGRLMPLNF